MVRILLFSFLISFVVKFAQSQTKLTMDQCLALLQSQNPDLRQSNINILLAKVDVKDAKNAYLPTLSFGAGHTYNNGLAFDQVAGQLITGNKWSNTANANISTRATLFSGFSRHNQFKLALLAVESRELQQNQLQQSLRLELLSRYFDAVANHSLYEASLKQLDYAKEQLTQDEVKFKLEVNTLVDVAQAESQVANNELNTIVNNDAYNSSLIALKQLLGISLEDSIVLDNPMDQTTTMKEQIILTNNDDPSIQLGELAIKQSELSLKNAKTSYYPSLSFFGGYGTNYSSERNDYLTGGYMPFWDQVDQNRSLNFGLSLSVPIFDAYKTKNNISRIKLDLQSKQIELSKTKTEREKVNLLAMQEYKKSLKEYQVLRVQYTALEKNYLALKERYNLGVTNAMDYNKALLDFNMAEFNVIKAKYTVLYNIEVMKVLRGGG